MGAGPIAVLLASPIAVRPQSAGKVFRVGYLANSIPLADLEKGASSPFPSVADFVEGLRKRGWHDGKNIHIVWRSAEGKLDRHLRLADELARMPVDVIVAYTEGVDAAAAATKTIPIVMGGHYFPVESGLAESLNRPGRNVTGLLAAAGPAAEKQLALLKEASPGISRVALVSWVQGEPADRGTEVNRRLVAAAKELGLEVFWLTFGEPGEIDALIQSAVRQGTQALLLAIPTILYVRGDHLQRINRQAILYRLPVIHDNLDAAEGGALMAYGVDDRFARQRAPHYVDRILRGERPAVMPIEQSTKVELHVNLGAAKAIGLKIPPALLLQADRVIQ